MFDCVCLAVMCVVVGFAAWKGDGPERRMKLELDLGHAPSRTPGHQLTGRQAVQRSEAIALKWDLFAAAVALVLGATAAAALLVGAQADHFKDVLIMSSVVGLTGGFYGVYRAVKLLVPSSEAAASAECAQRREAEEQREAWLRTPKAVNQHVDTSLMEIRLAGSLKSIRDAAEQGLFASDAEKGQHLRAIWSMAACDLDDDPDKVAH